MNPGGPGGGRPLGASAEFLRPKLVERASKQGVSEEGLRAAAFENFFQPC